MSVTCRPPASASKRSSSSTTAAAWWSLASLGVSGPSNPDGCLKVGRRGYAIELDPHYVDARRARVGPNITATATEPTQLHTVCGRSVQVPETKTSSCCDL